ncbi:DUF5602 domain-containing protein [Halotia wernerae UHCC 0503]|nr:DUF5602 domain-containing protein [Halotia wernerae UHCC 0503]
MYIDIGKKITFGIAGTVCSAVFLGMQSASAHGLHLHPDSEDTHSGSHQPPLTPITSSQDPRLSLGSVVYGTAQPLGNGTARTWVKLSDQGIPTDIGVTLTEASLSGLPDNDDDLGEYPLKLKLLDGIGNSTFEYELLFPEVTASIPFTHMALNWNPLGHAPSGVTTLPHFDFHFNLFTPEERDAITADNLEDFIAKAYKAPPSELIAPGYVTVPNAGEPRMGVHYFNPTSAEFQRPFDRVFIYGSYDGKMAFWEPMITKAFLESKPNTIDPIIQPSAYPTSGYYPIAYSVNYANKEYSVSLNGLTFRTVPEPNLILGMLGIGVLSTISLLKRKPQKIVYANQFFSDQKG